MDDDEQEDISSSTAGQTHRANYLWIRGVPLSIYDYPECFESEEFDCEYCEFYSSEVCPFLRESYLSRDIKDLLDLRRERHKAYIEQQQSLLDAIGFELQSHGRPLHYTVLAQMVADRHPELQVTEWQTVRVMISHPEMFEWVAEGVYKYRSS